LVWQLYQTICICRESRGAQCTSGYRCAMYMSVCGQAYKLLFSERTTVVTTLSLCSGLESVPVQHCVAVEKTRTDNWLKRHRRKCTGWCCECTRWQAPPANPPSDAVSVQCGARPNHWSSPANPSKPSHRNGLHRGSFGGWVLR
jgi:hypothetical protein